MKRQLTAADTKKTALALGLLLVLCGAGWFAARKASAGREEARMGEQMDREADLPAAGTASNSVQEVENDPEKQLLTKPNY